MARGRPAQEGVAVAVHIIRICKRNGRTSHRAGRRRLVAVTPVAVRAQVVDERARESRVVQVQLEGAGCVDNAVPPGHVAAAIVVVATEAVAFGAIRRAVIGQDNVIVIIVVIRAARGIVANIVDHADDVVGIALAYVDVAVRRLHLLQRVAEVSVRAVMIVGKRQRLALACAVDLPEVDGVLGVLGLREVDFDLGRARAAFVHLDLGLVQFERVGFVVRVVVVARIGQVGIGRARVGVHAGLALVVLECLAARLVLVQSVLVNLVLHQIGLPHRIEHGVAAGERRHREVRVGRVVPVGRGVRLIQGQKRERRIALGVLHGHGLGHGLARPAALVRDALLRIGRPANERVARAVDVGVGGQVLDGVAVLCLGRFLVAARPAVNVACVLARIVHEIALDGVEVDIEQQLAVARHDAARVGRAARALLARDGDVMAQVLVTGGRVLGQREVARPGRSLGGRRIGPDDQARPARLVPGEVGQLADVTVAVDRVCADLVGHLLRHEHVHEPRCAVARNLHALDGLPDRVRRVGALCLGCRLPGLVDQADLHDLLARGQLVARGLGGSIARGAVRHALAREVRGNARDRAVAAHRELDDAVRRGAIGFPHRIERRLGRIGHRVLVAARVVDGGSSRARRPALEGVAVVAQLVSARQRGHGAGVVAGAPVHGRSAGRPCGGRVARGVRRQHEHAARQRLVVHVQHEAAVTGNGALDDARIHLLGLGPHVLVAVDGHGRVGRHFLVGVILQGLAQRDLLRRVGERVRVGCVVVLAGDDPVFHGVVRLGRGVELHQHELAAVRDGRAVGREHVTGDGAGQVRRQGSLDAVVQARDGVAVGHVRVARGGRARGGRGSGVGLACAGVVRHALDDAVAAQLVALHDVAGIFVCQVVQAQRRGAVAHDRALGNRAVDGAVIRVALPAGHRRGVDRRGIDGVARAAGQALGGGGVYRRVAVAVNLVVLDGVGHVRLRAEDGDVGGLLVDAAAPLPRHQVRRRGHVAVHHGLLGVGVAPLHEGVARVGRGHRALRRAGAGHHALGGNAHGSAGARLVRDGPGAELVEHGRKHLLRLPRGATRQRGHEGLRRAYVRIARVHPTHEVVARVRRGSGARSLGGVGGKRLGARGDRAALARAVDDREGVRRVHVVELEHGAAVGGDGAGQLRERRREGPVGTRVEHGARAGGLPRIVSVVGTRHRVGGAAARHGDVPAGGARTRHVGEARIGCERTAARILEQVADGVMRVRGRQHAQLVGLGRVQPICTSAGHEGKVGGHPGVAVVPAVDHVAGVYGGRGALRRIGKRRDGLAAAAEPACLVVGHGVVDGHLRLLREYGIVGDGVVQVVDAARLHRQYRIVRHHVAVGALPAQEFIARVGLGGDGVRHGSA